MRQMTDEEKQEKMMQVEAGLAFGGGKLSPEMRKDVEDILDGKVTADDVRAKLKEKYTGR